MALAPPTPQPYAALRKLVPEIQLTDGEDAPLLLNVAGVVWQAIPVDRPWTVRDVGGLEPLGKTEFYAVPSATALARQRLRERQISYVTDAGQAYLRLRGTVLIVEFPDVGVPRATNDKLMSFTTASLRLAFALVGDETLLGADLRTLAERSGIGLGSVKRGLDYLVKEGYLSKGTRFRWLDREGLIDAWVEGYAARLRDKGYRKYVGVKDFDPARLPEDFQLGGPEATRHYGGQLLSGGRYTLYSNLSYAEVARRLKAVPSSTWNVEVCGAFWAIGEPRVVPPLIAYADMLLEGGRGVEEAAKIKFSV